MAKKAKSAAKSNQTATYKHPEPTEEVKRAAAERWVTAVNADGTYGKWRYAVAKKVSDVPGLLS